MAHARFRPHMRRCNHARLVGGIAALVFVAMCFVANPYMLSTGAVFAQELWWGRRGRDIFFHFDGANTFVLNARGPMGEARLGLSLIHI